ncbi:RNA-directed DNA polymerase, eukaryota, reverse transcriptase zinc-binding domain protein [Tanacetum coccineum]
MVKPTKHTDSNGCTWIFRNNKTTSSKPIGNPFHRDVDKVATSFYLSNFPDSLNAKGLWNAYSSYGRLVDAFIANKGSKMVARFQSPNHNKADINHYSRVPQTNPNPNFIHTNSNLNPNPNNFSLNSNDLHSDKHSFASIVHGKPKTTKEFTSPDKTRVVSLIEQDLIGINDSSRVLLVKLKDLDTASNMLNATMINISSSIKTISPSFKVDERLVEQSTSMSMGRICISTKLQLIVSEKVKVEIHEEIFKTLVHEIGNWSINIVDESDTSSIGDENKVDKDVTSSDDSLVDGMEDVIKNLHTDIEDEEPNIGSPKANAKVSSVAKELNVSDLRCPPGFEYMKRDSTRRCSTSFAKRRNKDIKGISFFHELSQLIEVGGSLGLDVRGCRRWENTVGDCYMINIYGPQDPLAKSMLWNRIQVFMQSNSGNYILFGDMNEVRNAQERHGSIFSRSEVEMNKQGTKLSKLDRFLISEEVLNLLPDIKITILDHLWSDHSTILLNCSKRDFDQIPFKIFHSWFKREGFDELINSELSNFSSLSSHDKLKALKPKIRLWHNTLRSKEISRKQDAIKSLQILEDKIDAGYGSNEDRFLVLTYFTRLINSTT